MRDTDNIRAVADLDIDMMGFVFYQKSPRYVQMISSMAGIIPDYSEERLAKSMNNPTESNVERIKRVGVFVDDMPQTIVTRVYNYNLDYVQLHGCESRIMIENLLRTLHPDIQPNIKVIKALKIADKKDVEQYKEYEGVADMMLFDTACEEEGGSGRQFDWSLLETYDGQMPFLLGGGIEPDDVQRIRQIHHPMFAGIDLNSCFEIEPGIKDIEKLANFISKIRTAYE